jgi:hypothetical protein
LKNLPIFFHKKRTNFPQKYLTHFVGRHELVVGEKVEDGVDGVVGDAVGGDSNARPRVGQALARQLAAVVEGSAAF